MNAEAKTEAASSPIGEPGVESGPPVFLSLKQGAELEFHASVQLLAERARFVTGAASAAVALEQGGQFVYCAASGSPAPELGVTADVTRYPLRKCIKTGQAVRLPRNESGSHSALAIPVLRDEKVVGFFEVVPGAIAFEDAEVAAIARLSAMVSTALDHLDAAEHTESLIRREERKPEVLAAPAGPVLWHAPEPTASELVLAKNPQSPTPTDVRTCSACGFPVSGVRTLCLDCETHQDDSQPIPTTDQKPAVELFAVQKQESWISAHGYTIASLLVTALAAAIILWLR